MSYVDDDGESFDERYWNPLRIMDVKTLIVICLPVMAAWVTAVIVVGRTAYEEFASDEGATGDAPLGFARR